MQDAQPGPGFFLRQCVGVLVENPEEGAPHGGAAQPLPGVLAQQPLHGLGEGTGAHRRPQRQPVDSLQGGRGTVAVTEGRTSLDQCVEDRAERPQVGGRPDALVTGLFGGGVRRCREPGGEGRAGQAPAGDDDGALVVHEHLAGAEFAVRDALAVRRLQHLQQFQADARRPYVVERPLAAEEFAQGDAVDRLGDGPQGVLLRHGVHDRGDPAGERTRMVLDIRTTPAAVRSEVSSSVPAGSPISVSRQGRSAETSSPYQQVRLVSWCRTSRGRYRPATNSCVETCALTMVIPR